MPDKPKVAGEDIRRFADTRIVGWEDSLKSEGDANIFLKQIELVLGKYGVSLNENPILEVGSGHGFLLKAMKEKGYDVVGVDARARGVEKDRLVEARIEELPFRDNTFGVIFAIGVFDAKVYLQNQDLMLREMSRVLSPQGSLLIFGTTLFEKQFNPEQFGLHLISDPEKQYIFRLFKKD